MILLNTLQIDKYLIILCASFAGLIYVKNVKENIKN